MNSKAVLINITHINSQIVIMSALPPPTTHSFSPGGSVYLLPSAQCKASPRTCPHHSSAHFDGVLTRAPDFNDRSRHHQVKEKTIMRQDWSLTNRRQHLNQQKKKRHWDITRATATKRSRGACAASHRAREGLNQYENLFCLLGLRNFSPTFLGESRMQRPIVPIANRMATVKPQVWKRYFPNAKFQHNLIEKGFVSLHPGYTGQTSVPKPLLRSKSREAVMEELRPEIEVGVISVCTPSSNPEFF